ncbi:3-oxoacyl-ACP synthase III family protein [Marinomonas transparens]|uniref:Ketoacyl-ACP synthase III n=1 Tax=Marinomonas transparens TaxID=2795388 RepID=A0A934N8F6_9GAMM|nr:ketoacyl-ACP synthase III [Marinomonas transparens]MBJ7540041.1 ketoacyl-ACP synthase III [Marinomonas transparens]
MKIKANCQIAGIGIYFPRQIVTSQELMREIKSEENFGIAENWINEVCGIDERRVASAEELPSILAIRAAENALQDSGVQPSEIDAVIFCGISREWLEPSVAHKVQHEMGCTNAICFDVSNACHGFMNGILLADNLMQCSDATHVLVVAGENLTDITFDYVAKLRNKTAEFQKVLGTLTVGDSGAAMVLTPKNKDGRGFQYYNFHTDAKHTDLCRFSTAKEGGYDGQMVMGKISSVMIRLHASIIEQTYQSLNWKNTDIDHLICHQVGQKPHIRMADMAKVSQSIAPISYKLFGNITTATIPANLYNVKPNCGEKILIAGAGSGLSISQSGLVF